MLGKITVPILLVILQTCICVASLKRFISQGAAEEETLLPLPLTDVLHWSKLLLRYLTQRNSSEMLSYFTRSDMPATDKEYMVPYSGIIYSQTL